MYQSVGPSPDSISSRGTAFGSRPARSISLAVAAAFCRCSSSCWRMAGGIGSMIAALSLRAPWPLSVRTYTSKELLKDLPVFCRVTRLLSTSPALQSMPISSLVKASCRIRRGRASRMARILGSASFTGCTRVPPAFGFQLPAQMGRICVSGCGKLSVAAMASSTGAAACRKSRCVSPPAGVALHTSHVPQLLPKAGASPKYSSSHLRRQHASPA
mmetsp:Transcript_15156/g.38989  ORF Transcript_15156/g.38989 Transcript_15156/m.38989 type:complete len:215 (+) Transcript_15156:935-1579(+)